MGDPQYVMWIDPGLASGWAAYDYAAQSFVCGEEELTGMGERIRAVATAIPVEQLAVGCEDYLSLGGPGTPRYSHQVIGMVTRMAYEYGFTMLPLVPSSMRKLASIGKLKKLGWYKPTPGGHAIDASRHLLAYMLRNHRQRKLPVHIHNALFVDAGDTLIP